MFDSLPTPDFPSGLYALTQTKHRDEMDEIVEENDPWHLPIILLFLLSISVNCFYSFFRWINIFHALPVILCKNKEIKSSAEASEDNYDCEQQRSPSDIKIEEPAVTIQICTYNEGDVVAETLRRACAIDWPREKLIIEVLDDSTDPKAMCAVTEAVNSCSLMKENAGMSIIRKTRPDREGYKAGNLAYNFDGITTKFIVYIDEDHWLEPTFLRATIPCFFDAATGKLKDNVGLVQAPWAYQNTKQSMLTETDALGLDIHHVTEQTGRGSSSGCFGFNGTGGVWLKQAIVDAGGWTSDTVTEDLDLSYRAIMKGYRFEYLHAIPQPLEVPSDMRAHVQQKSRWTKGFFQVFRLSFFNFVASREVDWFVKLQTFAHVTGGVQFITIAISLVLYPMLVLHDIDHAYIAAFFVIPLLDTVVGGILTSYFKVPTRKDYYTTFGRKTWRILFIFTHVALKCGISLFEAKAVVEGMLSNDATFLTTPKGAAKQAGKGSVKVKRNDMNNLIAFAGLVLGIHRLSFVVFTVRWLPIATVSDLAFWFFNCTLCFGLFWVNVSYLFEGAFQAVAPLKKRISITAQKALRRSSMKNASAGATTGSRTRISGALALIFCYTVALMGVLVNNKVVEPGVQDSARMVMATFQHRAMYKPVASCLPDDDEITFSSRQPLVVFGMARTGSNLLFEMIDRVFNSTRGSEADVLNMYELFATDMGQEAGQLFKGARVLSKRCIDPDLWSLAAAMKQNGWNRRGGWDNPQKFIDFLTEQAKRRPNIRQWINIHKNRRIDPLNAMDYLTGLPSKAEKPVLALKVFDGHLGSDLATQSFASAMQHYSGTKYVFIWRRRLIEAFVSKQIALRNNAWTNQDTGKEVVKIDRARLEDFIEKKRNYYRGVREKLDSIGAKYTVFEYERDFSSAEAKIETVRRLQNIVGLETSDQAEKIAASLSLKKQSKTPLSEQVSNWDEVVSWGYGGELEEWEDLFARPDELDEIPDFSSRSAQAASS